MRPLRATPAALAGPVLLAFALAAASCRKAGPEGRRHALAGVVVSVNRAVQEVVVAHEDIPGFMPAMTMPFPLTDPQTLASLAPGDTITATLVVGETSYRLEDVKVTGKAALAAPPASPPSAGAEPNAGDEAPDVTLVNQDGHTFRLSDYRGKALAVTLLFTRCPIPDFCPRMGEQFAEILAALARDPALRERTHLLGISFDPEFDTPTVLRRWGLRFVKEAGFDRFELATGEPAEIARLAGFLTLDYEKDDGSFTHNLRSAVFSPDGTLFRLHRGNDWTPAMLLADLREAGARPRPAP